MFYLSQIAGKNTFASAGDARPWVQCLGWEDPLEKEMHTCSSILAQKLPWTEELRKPWGLKELDTAEHGHTYTKDYDPGDSPSGNSEELLQRSMIFSSCMSFQNKLHQTSQGHIPSRLKKKKKRSVCTQQVPGKGVLSLKKYQHWHPSQGGIESLFLTWIFSSSSHHSLSLIIKADVQYMLGW